jgi:hypothetical protein
VRDLNLTAGQEVSGLHLITLFIRRRVQPLQARVRALWDYEGARDPCRTKAEDLSHEEVEMHLRSLTKLTDEVGGECPVTPYGPDRALSGVSLFVDLLAAFLPFYRSSFFSISSRQEHITICYYPPQPEAGPGASGGTETSVPPALSQEEDEEVDQASSPVASASRKRGQSSEEPKSSDDGGDEESSPPLEKEGAGALTKSSSDAGALRIDPLRAAPPPLPKKPRRFAGDWDDLLDVE